MLFRLILWLVGILVAISVVRSIVGLVTKLFSELTGTGAQDQGPARRKPAAPISESLKRDPVCGTYIAPSTAVQKSIGGTTYYFCSVNCRDKFKAA